MGRMSDIENENYEAFQAEGELGSGRYGSER